MVVEDSSSWPILRKGQQEFWLLQIDKYKYQDTSAMSVLHARGVLAECCTFVFVSLHF